MLKQILSQTANQTYIIKDNHNHTLKNTVYINYLQELLQFATETFDQKKNPLEMRAVYSKFC